MYLFGGTMGLTSNSKFYALDLQSFKWELIRAKAADNDAGNLPEPLDEHSAVVCDDKMILFGGFVNGERCNSVYSYKISSNEWRLLPAQSTSAPCPRAGHSAMMYSENSTNWMYVFGGKNDEDKLNDIWRFDLDAQTWEQVISVDDTQPLQRSGHSAVLYKDFMVVFGGIFEITKELNDLMLFDLKNLRWVEFFEESGGLSPHNSIRNNPSSPRRLRKQLG